MKTYSLVMVLVCAFFFGMASLGTIGDFAAVLGGPEFALDEPESRRYSDFEYYKGYIRDLAGRHGDRVILGEEGDLRAQWQGYRESLEIRSGELAARDLLHSLVMFVVFGGLFLAHFYAYRAYSGITLSRPAKARAARPAPKPARVRKLRPKAAARKRSAAGKRPARKAA